MKRKQGVIIVLSVIYAFCIVYGNDIMNNDTVAYMSRRTWGKIAIWSVIMYFCTNLCRFFIQRVLGIKVCLPKTNTFKPLKFFLLVWGVILLGWLPVYVACYPGLAIYDGPTQTELITTHHPLVHTLFIQGLNYFAQKAGWESWVAPYAVIQMAALSAAFAYLLTCLRKWGYNTVYICAVLAWIVFFPMHPLMAVATTKDTFFTVCFILLVCELVKMIRGGYFEEKNNRLRFMIICSFLCLLRNNGVYILIIMTPFLMLGFKAHCKRIALICLSVIVGYYLYTGPLMDAMRIPKGDKREAMTMVIQPLARTYRDAGASLSEEEREAIRRLFGNNDPWYESHISDAAKSQFDSKEFFDNAARYTKLYISLGVRYPDIYLDAVLANTYGNWYPHETLPDPTCYRMYFEFPAETAGEYGSRLPGLYNFLQRLCRESTYLEIPFLYIIFCTGIVCWIILFLAAEIVIRGEWRKLMVFVPFGALFFTILLGPVALLRYT